MAKKKEGQLNIDIFKHKNLSQNCPYQITDNKGYFNCCKHDGSVGFCNFCMLVKTKLASSSLEVDVGSITYLATGSVAQSGLVKAKARGF
jgi:hypothetical protein